MWRARSEQRKRTACATSSGSPMRPRTVSRAARSRTASGRRSTSGVRMKPGETALTQTPKRPSSAAAERVSANTPAFDAA